MKPIRFLLLLIVAISVMSFEHPQGWVKDGKVYKYEITMTPDGHNGKNAVTIKSLSTTVSSDASSIWQNSLPNNFIGKRVRMTAYLRCNDVKDTAGIWFNVLNAPVQTLETDGKYLTGTSNWKKIEIVLDIPKGASNLNYGAFLNGKGQIWFSDISFEVVDNSISSTSKKSETYVPRVDGPIDAKKFLLATQDLPTNLDFAATVKAD
jgi:hypothetical protein